MNEFKTQEILTTERSSSFTAGLKAGLPIAVGYLPIAVTFGLLARSAGVPGTTAVLMSWLVFAGASQFVAVNLIALGTHPWEIVMTTFVVNLRHFLMTASLSQRLAPELSTRWRSLLAFGVTDETFSVASMQEGVFLERHYLLGLNMIAWLAWVSGTWAGVFLAGGLPVAIQASMGIALYAMFIGLLAPSLRNGRPVILVVAAAICAHVFLSWAPTFAFLAPGWRLVIASTCGAVLGAIVYPEGVSRA